MKTLSLAPGLTLPIDAVTQKIAFLGRTGSGKTYGATKLAEEMLDAGAQIIALDPVGVWFGLRISSDGKGAGKSIPVFGGLHGDLPLEPTSGVLMANIICDRGISAVLDVSQMISSEQQRFATEFATRLFERRKAAPSATMLFLEECQEFVAQNPMRGDERMLHAFNRLIKIGRNFGIGISLISQRPQEVNKKALNLTECLFTFQMTGTQERKAIKEWVAYQGEIIDVDQILPRLAVGEACVWSPQWLQISQRVKIAKKTTFNASSTPLVGARAIEPRALSPIDLEKIRVDMAETIERQKADDPTELRRQIAELKKQSAKPTAPQLPDQNAIAKAREQGANSVKAVLARELKKYVKEIEGIYGAVRVTMESVAGHSAKTAESLKSAARAFKDCLPPNPPSLEGIIEDVIKNAPPQIRPAETKPSPRAIERPRPVRTEGADTANLTGPERRILNAIAWLESIGIPQPEQTAVAFLAGYTVGGGGFNNPRGALKTKGLLEYVPGDKIALTEEGRKSAQFPEEVLDSAELQRRILDRLPGPEQRILQTILAAYPDAISNQDCASASGYTAGAGGYKNPRGRLKTLGLIEYPQAGHVRARDILFLK